VSSTVFLPPRTPQTQSIKIYTIARKVFDFKAGLHSPKAGSHRRDSEDSFAVLSIAILTPLHQPITAGHNDGKIDRSTCKSTRNENKKRKYIQMVRTEIQDTNTNRRVHVLH
jgi:hypothetical protein